ncbi:DNA repair protein RAD50, partial [Aureobasidium melanogenum]
MSDAGRQTGVARDEAAATTNAVPTNQLTEDIEHNSTSSVSTKRDDVQTAEEKPQLERKDSTPLEERSKGKIALIMTALGMAVFLAALDVTIITTALPTISEYFHSSAGYTWIGSAYLLGNASSVPLWGKISDIFGRKPILITANVLFLIGSLIAALANSIGMLIAARAIQGVGGGGLVTLVNICISDLFSLRRRGAYFGIIGGVWALASAIGPVIGGVFTEKVTWRWCFYINLPLDGAALIIIFFFLDLKTPRTPLWEGLKAIDWIGALLVIGGVLMFLFGLEYSGVTYPWDSATVLCLIIIGVFTMGLFIINEWKFAKSPVMPLRIFQNRSNIAVLGVCAIHGMVFISASYYLPLYFQAARGATPLLSANSSWAKLIIFQIIAGIGIGPNFQAPLIALQTGVQPRDIATATATFGFVRQIFTSISVVIGQTVYQNQMNSKTA